MPFRLDIAPRVFTKIMKLVVASLRSQGVLLIIYLDDILTIVSSVEILNLHKKLAIDLLEPLGFLINYKKSNLISFQQIVFLGMLVDLASMQFVLPQIKVVQIQKECRLLLNSTTPTIRHLSRLLGLLESCRPAIWSAPLHYRMVQVQCIDMFDTYSQNRPGMVDNRPTNTAGESNHSTISRYDHLFGCFQTGLGGIQRPRGCWSERESQDHINILELRAAFFALKSFLPSQTNRVVCLKMDNTTAVAYLHNMGGTHCHKLLHLALEVWERCEKRNIFLLPQHIQDKCQGRSRVAGESRFERL